MPEHTRNGKVLTVKDSEKEWQTKKEFAKRSDRRHENCECNQLKLCDTELISRKKI